MIQHFPSYSKSCCFEQYLNFAREGTVLLLLSYRPVEVMFMHILKIKGKVDVMRGGQMVRLQNSRSSGPSSNPRLVVVPIVVH